MNIEWNAEKYKENFDFVYKYGANVLDLLTVGKGSVVADLGCGNGILSGQLRDRGYDVLGIDKSEDMLRAARCNFPDIRFLEADALTFSLDKKADAVFSNAVFHWIDRDKQSALLKNIYSQLKEGGELVFEFGGKGCAERVHSKLDKIFSQHGLIYTNGFYFPTIGEYAPLMEQAGFKVTYAVLFDRPTPQKGENGLEEWIRMFDKKPFEGLDKDMADEIIAEAVDELKGEMYSDGIWYVDYVRIRMRAVRQ